MTQSSRSIWTVPWLTCCQPKTTRQLEEASLCSRLFLLQEPGQGFANAGTFVGWFCTFASKSPAHGSVFLLGNHPCSGGKGKPKDQEPWGFPLRRLRRTWASARTHSACRLQTYCQTTWPRCCWRLDSQNTVLPCFLFFVFVLFEGTIFKFVSAHTRKNPV